MKLLSLSDVEHKYSGILRGVCMLGENCLIYGLIQLASDTASAIGCILRQNGIPWYNDLHKVLGRHKQKKDFIVFYDKSSFLSRNIQKFETISTIDGFAFAFIFYVVKHNFGMGQTLSIVYSHLKFLCLLEIVYMRNTEPDILIHF